MDAQVRAACWCPGCNKDYEGDVAVIRSAETKLLDRHVEVCLGCLIQRLFAEGKKLEVARYAVPARNQY